MEPVHFPEAVLTVPTIACSAGFSFSSSAVRVPVPFSKCLLSFIVLYMCTVHYVKPFLAHQSSRKDLFLLSLPYSSKETELLSLINDERIIKYFCVWKNSGPHPAI